MYYIVNEMSHEVLGYSQHDKRENSFISGI